MHFNHYENLNLTIEMILVNKSVKINRQNSILVYVIKSLGLVIFLFFVWLKILLTSLGWQKRLYLLLTYFICNNRHQHHCSPPYDFKGYLKAYLEMALSDANPVESSIFGSLCPFNSLLKSIYYELFEISFQLWP